MRFLRNKTGNQYPVAIFHLSVKPISRSAGRSATAAAAYRAGEKIIDERTGEIHDYTRKGGVESADIVLPDGALEWATDRAKLWNAAELAEKRKDACVAREFEVALPAELSPAERRNLALNFAKDMANREGCAVDVAIHAPGKEGDNRNHHAHILRTTRKVEADGLGAKLDTEQAGRKRKDDLEQVRERWADLSNKALERAGHSARIDHRSLKKQGIDREPTVHLGPAASGYERRTGEPSRKRLDFGQEVAERLVRAREAGELERQGHQLDRSILDLSGDLAAAKAERDRPTVRAAGIDPRSAYHPDNIAKRAAQEAAPEKPAPLTTAERFELAKAEKQRLNAAKRPAEAERKPATAPPKLTLQEENALLLLGASAKKAQWDTSLKAERELYLGELTEQAYTKAVAGVALHQAHIDAKPMLFGREKWEEQRQGFENRDHANKLAWQQLKDGTYPFLSNDKEAVQEAVERRVSDKNPELARSIPKAVAALQEARERADALERGRQAQERAEKAKTQDLDKALSVFNVRALKREMKAFGHGDTGQQWNALPEPLRKAIEDYNRLPKEARPVVLERMRENMKRDPQAVEKLTQQLDQGKENDRGMSR